jgi:hypothetical protein
MYHFYSLTSFLYSSFNKIILEFYQQSSKKSLIVIWLPALPLLHFLRRESKPFEGVICEKSVGATNWKWWGWQDLPYREIRRNITERFAFILLFEYKHLYSQLKCHLIK